uniref:Aldehyde dehydrogenase n=1 Tax=Oryzias sinensis TaxID=183150 RepID=A0A8C7ZTV9_9TELE
MESQSQMVARLRAAFRSGVTVPEEFRRTQLTGLMSMIKDNEDQITDALHRDLPKFEAVLSEIEIVLNELYHSISNLARWMQPEYVSKSLATKLDDCFIRREPLGVVLIIGPWNYPLQLLILPLISAIAAGICASVAGMVLRINGGKPHRTSLRTDPNPRSAETIFPTCVSQKLPKNTTTQRDLNNILETKTSMSSQAVARSVVQAASVHLTPVTLELGGKCPCLIYGRINITAAARRLVWAKYFNAGQSCVAPDYLLCTKAVRDALVPEDDALMGQEIFGPILPILTVETLEEGIAFINRKEKPLALYVFSDESSTVMENTSSGGFCSNDAIIHMTLPSLPFGGVGMSGWGSYHGRWGFEEFSHRRACMLRGWALERLNGLRYPPYSTPAKHDRRTFWILLK